MKKNPPLPLLLGLVGALTATSHGATTFGVNFTTNASDHVSGTYLGTSAWTSSFAAVGSASTGATFNTTELGVSVSYSTANFWSGGQWGTAGTANQGLNVFRNYLDDGDTLSGSAPAVLGTQSSADGIGAVFQVAGLGAWLAANNATSYQVMLLLNTDTTGTTFRTYTVRSGDLQGTVLTSGAGIVRGTGNWDGTQIIAGSGGTATNGTRGDVTFTGLNADTITISAPSTGAGRGTIAGFVITAVPEPSTALLGGLGLLGLLRRRRA